MLKRNAPLLAFALVFVAVLYFVYSIPQYEPIVDVEEEEDVVEEAFTGRVEMPSIDEIYVIENTAGRDLNKLTTCSSGCTSRSIVLDASRTRKSCLRVPITKCSKSSS